MIDPSSWDTAITDIIPYTFNTAELPTPYIAKIYDKPDSESGESIPQVVNLVKTLGTPSNLIRATNGAYAEIQLNNAYDVILLDTILNTTT